MEDPEQKKLYQKHKLRVKVWEKEFTKRHSRVPSKHDIREAPETIRYAYKMYYKLKSSFLEDTLCDVFNEDGFDVLEMSQTENATTGIDESINESMTDVPQLPLDISAIVNDAGNSKSFSNVQQLPINAISNLLNDNDERVIKVFEAVENFELNKKSWGKNVSKKPVVVPAKKIVEPKQFKANLNFERFKNTSFAKRNPRKPLSRNNSSIASDTNTTINNDSMSYARETLPDFETILSRKAQQRQVTAGTTIINNSFLTAADKTKETIKTQVDEGWLQRNTGLNEIKTNLNQKQRNDDVSIKKPQSFGLSNIDMTKISTKVGTTVSDLRATLSDMTFESQSSQGVVSRSIEMNESERNGSQSSQSITSEATQLFNSQNIQIFGSQPKDCLESPTIKMMPSQSTEIFDSQATQLLETQTTQNQTNDPCYHTAKVTKQKRKAAVESDSDSVVSESDDETTRPIYRHIVKRRCTIKNIQNNNRPIEPVKLTVPTATVEIPFPATAANPEDELNKSFDFSADDDDDADYVLKKSKKGKRKVLTAKRVRKPVAKKEVVKKPKEKKPIIPKIPKPPRTMNSKKEPRAKKSTKSTKKTDKPSAVQVDTAEDEQLPPDPKDLKYLLALDSGEITAVPRVKMSELAAVDDVAQQYINAVPSFKPQPINSAAKSNVVINEKREAERRKLEQKIATGKLNENYRTINIQKKTFVRGKKNMNFSKYKKKMWKHQKHIAALTGPNMDMGGCDGGVLTCFTCGQVGHFAQNCKIKGDSLLPLSAQIMEDPSPFPTLEEAAQMATQSAVAVHSRNIIKLPKATNTAIFQNAEEENSADADKESDKEMFESEDKEFEIPASSSSDESENVKTENADAEEELLLATDDELENMDVNSAIALSGSQEKVISPIKQYVGHKIPTEFLKEAGLIDEKNATQFAGVHGLYDLNADGSVKDVTPEVMEVLHLFGHTNFRKGQDRAIMRILSGLSTLVTLSTGSGKSLCYQLPAYLYSQHKKAITLVISPLVSLMEDQVTDVPHFLRAHCLHTNQTPQQRAKVMSYIRDGEIDVLLVSPEAVVAGEKSTGFGAILRHLPPIAFACIDEAHCVSQWSHNFRPSYLMICKVLKKNLGVRTVLGLTATATLPTRLSIINHLGITDGERGIISDIPLPDNLILSVSKDPNKDQALLQLLFSQRFEECQSIIIYCTRRDECERIAGFLRSCLQESAHANQATQATQTATAEATTKKKRKRVNWQAEPYHAGMPASRRRTIQNAFMKNELRIVVATIAFGMGINKSDIRSVIHYNMPRNFESYVQEIGRAGRDGKAAHCHLFLDGEGNDQSELRRHIYANSIDRHVIRKLLQRIFVPCSCIKNLKGVTPSVKSSKDSANIEDFPVETTATLNVDASDFGAYEADAPDARQHVCPGHEIGFSVDKTVEALDIPAENISTLLCYMELDARWCINVLSSAYTMAKVISYGGAKYLKHAAKECPPLAMAIALQIKQNNFKDDANVIEFSVIDIAAAIGWNSGVVKYQLKNLEWVQLNGYPKRSPLTVSFFDLGFRLKAPGDFTDKEIDNALDTLYKRSVKQEETQLKQLQYVSYGLSAVAYNTYGPCTSENFKHDRSDQLKNIIRNYFRNDYPKELKLEVEPDAVPDDFIEGDVHNMLNIYPDNNFSGRNIARIFHGIPSPNYPAVIWGRCKYWRAHSKSNFNRIVQLANAVIVKRRT